MKKRLFLLLLFLFPLSANSQVLISLLLGDQLNTGKIEFGLEGGFTWAKIANMESPSLDRSFNLGFYFDIRLKAPWYVYTGVLVRARQGTGGLTENDLRALNAEIYQIDGDYSQVISTFLVPLAIKYRTPGGFFALGGFQFGLMYDGYIYFYSEAENKETEIKEYNEDMLNRIDAGLTAGIGYKIPHEKDNGLSFTFRVYYGFVDAYKNLNGTKNMNMFLTMTVPIGAE